jgi:hypothetical protein
MTDKRTTPSAEGEANAIGGYWKQYEYSATCIYRAMREGSLEGLWISDLAAGLFDDVVIEMSEHVVAVQVKSTRASKYINLATELTPTFVHKLAESWVSLRLKHPDRTLRVRYVFPALFSDQDTALSSLTADGRKDSAAFAEFVSGRIDPASAASSIWADKFEKLERASGLSSDDFWRFMAALELRDERELLKNRIENFEPSEADRVTAIRNLLPTLVADPGSRRRWMDSELVKRLGWTHRLILRNVHEFPVPEDYQGNPATEAALERALTLHASGYIALVGPPGTGKSTLLQRTIHSTPQLGVSRYLAFHPDTRNGLGRAEASAFLNDIVGELRTLGLGGSLYYIDNITAVRTELQKQLNEASRRYKETGKRTLILVDGLDHVTREETPLSSFLPELPAANSVPEGVIFLLGTQHLDLEGLHPTIIQQVQESNRTIDIQPLPRAAIFEMARIAELPGYMDRSALFDASRGHPLVARYLVQALKKAPDEREVSRILSLEGGLGETTEQIYERVWQKLDASLGARHALGLLGRAEGSITPEQLASLTSDADVEEMLAKAEFLLSMPSEGRLSMFHNSFRLFVARETARKFGRHNEALEQAFYTELARIAADAPIEDPQHWMELRYHARGKNAAEVLRIGKADYFRRSLARFRPSGDVISDLRFTFAAVKLTRDRVLLLEKLLIGKEIDYRLEAVSNLGLVELFMDLGDYDLALKHALAGEGGDTGWVALIDELWRSGHRELARQVFEMNEPLDVIMGDGTYDPSHDRTAAESWARSAHRFRPHDKLIELANSITPSQGLDDQETFRRRLRYKLTQGIVGDDPDADIRSLCGRFDLGEQEYIQLTIEKSEVFAVRDLHEKSIAALTEASELPELASLHPSWRRFAVRLAWRARDQGLALTFTSTLTIPRLERVLGDSIGEGSDASAEEVYETALLSELTGAKLPEEAIRARNERSVILTRFHEKLIALAKVRASAERGAEVDVPSLRALVLFFARARPEPGDFGSYKFFGAFGWLGRTLARAFVRLPTEMGKSLIEYTDGLVRQEETNFFNNSAFQTSFAQTLYRHDKDQNAAAARLKHAEDNLDPARTPHEVVDAKAEFARAYASVGLSEEAWRSLDAMHADTFGYWLRAKKEPQYTFWTWAFLNACRDATPESIVEFSAVFARFVLGMDHTEGDGTAVRVLPKLMEGAVGAPPIAAAIFRRLVDSDLVSWESLTGITITALAKHHLELGTMLVACVGRLECPFLFGVAPESVTSVLTAVPSERRLEAAHDLARDMAIFTPVTVRAEMLEAIVEVVPAAEDMVRPLVEIANATRQSLSLKDKPAESESGTSLDIEADSLADLLTKGDGRSDYGTGADYSFCRAAQGLVPTSSKDEIETFLAARPVVERDVKLVAAIATRLLELGEREAALLTFAKAEAEAYSGHWSAFMGGEKLAVQKLRNELYGAVGREAGFDRLIDELASGQTSASSLFLNLDDVLELITVEMPFEGWWRATQVHLQSYREYALADEVVSAGDVTSGVELIALLVATSFETDCSKLVEHARSVAASCSADNHGARFVEKLFELVKLHPNGERECVALLRGMVNNDSLREFVRREANLALKSADYVVSGVGELILMRLGDDVDELEPSPLPAFYNIISVPSPRDEDFEMPSGLNPGERPMWSDDPWTWTTMLRRPLRLLARASRISVGTLRRRCADLMRQEGGRGAFGPEVEERVVSRLRRLRLRMPYHRQLPMAALRAFGRVLQELALADAFDQRVIPMMWDEVGGPTLGGVVLAIEARQEWWQAPILPQRQYGGLEKEQWLEGTDGLHSQLLPNHHLLAEHSTVKVSLWGDVAEYTRTVLPAGADLERAIWGLPTLVSMDELHPAYAASDSQLVCHVPKDNFGDVNRSVVTICPFVIDRMGWERMENDPLTIVDNDGIEVARTILWDDGTDISLGREERMFASGQALLVTTAARSQLEHVYGRLNNAVRLTRGLDGESGRSESRSLTAP